MYMVYLIRVITFTGSKIIYVLSNLGVIFPGKKTVKAKVELIHELKVLDILSVGTTFE